ncbi:MAG TPA: hypothetical protein VLV83_04805 [Acidobacteriota bacterium]|nr:hypothetical protein [Acidobacteriota bacterium]
MMDLERIHQLIEAHIECCRQALQRHRDLDPELARRNGQGLRSWSLQQQEDAGRVRDLNRQLSRLLQGRSLTEVAGTLEDSESDKMLEKSRELARVSADWRLANARSFRLLQRTASASQSMLEQVYGIAGGYDNRGNIMNSYRSGY